MINAVAQSTPYLPAHTAQKTVVVKRARLKVFATVMFCMVGVYLFSRNVLLGQSLRLDESQSIWQSSHSISGLLHTVALDVHVPLYHLLLHFWLFYFGDSVQAVRLLSLLLFLASWSTTPSWY